MYKGANHITYGIELQWQWNEKMLRAVVTSICESHVAHLATCSIPVSLHLHSISWD